MMEDEIVGWHHLFNGHEFEQSLGDSERQAQYHVAVPFRCCSLFGKFTPLQGGIGSKTYSLQFCPLLNLKKAFITGCLSPVTNNSLARTLKRLGRGGGAYGCADSN